MGSSVPGDFIPGDAEPGSAEDEPSFSILGPTALAWRASLSLLGPSPIAWRAAPPFTLVVYAPEPLAWRGSVPFLELDWAEFQLLTVQLDLDWLELSEGLTGGVLDLDWREIEGLVSLLLDWAESRADIAAAEELDPQRPYGVVQVP